MTTPTKPKPDGLQFEDHFVFRELQGTVRTHVAEDEFEKQVTTFSLNFDWGDGGGYTFDCDSAGTVQTEDLPAEAHKNYLHCMNHPEEFGRIVVRAHTSIRPKCDCGSGLEPEPQHDARGIYLCRTCPKCRRAKLSGYRQDILTDPDYIVDEPIEDETC